MGDPIEQGSPIPGVESTPQAAPQGSPDRPTQVFEVDGQKVPIDDLINGYRKGQDYTRKTSDVARAREQISEYLPLIEDIEKFPELQQSIYDWYEDRQMQEAPEGQQVDHQVMGALQSLNERLSNWELRQTMDNLHNRYGDFDEQALIDTCIQRGTTDLELVHQAMLAQQIPEIAQMARTEIAQGIQQGQEAALPNMSQPSAVNQPPAEPLDPTQMSSKDLRAAALAEYLGQTGVQQ